MSDLNICEENRMRISTIERSYTKALERLASIEQRYAAALLRQKQAENAVLATTVRQLKIVSAVSDILAEVREINPGIDFSETLHDLGEVLCDIQSLVAEARGDEASADRACTVETACTIVSDQPCLGCGNCIGDS